MRVLRFVILLLGLVSSLALTPTLAAEKFPSRPIKFVVGFSAGGPTDTVARIMCEWLSPYLGQPCVVEDRVGSGGMIAAHQVINSPPDGYTIMFVAPNNVIGNSLYKNLPFVFLRDSAPVAGLMRLTNVMVVPPSLGVMKIDFNALKEMPVRAAQIDWARPHREHAAAWTAPYWRSPAEFKGSLRTATRVIPCAICLSRSNHFPPKLNSKFDLTLQ